MYLLCKFNDDIMYEDICEGWSLYKTQEDTEFIYDVNHRIIKIMNALLVDQFHIHVDSEEYYITSSFFKYSKDIRFFDIDDNELGELVSNKIPFTRVIALVNIERTGLAEYIAYNYITKLSKYSAQLIRRKQND